MSTIDGGIVALGAGFVVTTGGGIWKAASLRSDVFKEYQSRVALAQAALDERAAKELRELAIEVNRALGDLDRFDPHQALADPSTLQAHVNVVNRALTARRKLPRYFRAMLRCGPSLLALLSLLMVGVLLAFSYFTGWKRDREVGYIGLWASLILVLASVLVSAWYFALLYRFTSAEVFSAEGNDD